MANAPEEQNVGKMSIIALILCGKKMRPMNRFTFLILYAVLFFPFSFLYGQYAPPAGQEGSTAIAADSAIIINWAKACTIERGWKDIARPDSGRVTFGDSTAALGPALENGVVSLGDAGAALCTFDPPISNGPGWDFAVFENGFSDEYLELAFVEVSSDGVNFVRFPAVSLTDTTAQTGPFGLTDARLIHNLAGKYRIGFGTPFDLEELADSPGLDLNLIKYVRIVDVIGSVQPEWSSRDIQGHPVNDPYPTPFESGGFDLDAIGVIHQNSPTPTIGENQFDEIRFFPNPANSGQALHFEGHSSKGRVQLWSVNGTLVLENSCPAGHCRIDLPSIPKGWYLLRGRMGKRIFNLRILVQ